MGAIRIISPVLADIKSQVLGATQTMFLLDQYISVKIRLMLKDFTTSVVLAYSRQSHCHTVHPTILNALSFKTLPQRFR